MIEKKKLERAEERERAVNEEFMDFSAKFGRPEMQEKIAAGKFQGSSGTPVQLKTNFVRCDLDIMNSGKDHVYQYRVDFDPISDNVHMKKEMLEYVLEDQVDKHIFEGTMVFTFQEIGKDKRESYKFECTPDGTTDDEGNWKAFDKPKTYTITLNLSNKFIPNNPLGVQVVNLINRENIKGN